MPEFELSINPYVFYSPPTHGGGNRNRIQPSEENPLLYYFPENFKDDINSYVIPHQQPEIKNKKIYKIKDYSFFDDLLNLDNDSLYDTMLTIKSDIRVDKEGNPVPNKITIPIIVNGQKYIINSSDFIENFRSVCKLLLEKYSYISFDDNNCLLIRKFIRAYSYLFLIAKEEVDINNIYKILYRKNYNLGQFPDSIIEYKYVYFEQYNTNTCWACSVLNFVYELEKITKKNDGFLINETYKQAYIDVLKTLHVRKFINSVYINSVLCPNTFKSNVGYFPIDFFEKIVNVAALPGLKIHGYLGKYYKSIDELVADLQPSSMNICMLMGFSFIHIIVIHKLGDGQYHYIIDSLQRLQHSTMKHINKQYKEYMELNRHVRKYRCLISYTYDTLSSTGGSISLHVRKGNIKRSNHVYNYGTLRTLVRLFRQRRRRRFP